MKQEHNLRNSKKSNGLQDLVSKLLTRYTLYILTLQRVVNLQYLLNLLVKKASDE